MDEKRTGQIPANVQSPGTHEVVRQAAVYASGVLNMVGDPALQQVVEQAAHDFAVPMAAVSILDRDRQWFPACVGLDVEETSRDVSFCSYAIEQPGGILTVLDASSDARFRDNPMVTGPSHIRFYLGCPVLDGDGRALGTLCVIDVAPRDGVSDADYDRLRELAGQAAVIIAQFETSSGDRSQALETIGAQIENLVRAGDESLVTELDAMLRRLERQEERLRRFKS